jgi:hypothetical protein
MRQPQDNHVDQDGHADSSGPSVDRCGQVGSVGLRSKAPLPLYIGIGLVTILILVAAAAALSKQFRHQLALSIVRQPTPYTQLYFPHPGTLPGKLKVDRKNTFQFAIVNDENRAVRYTYIVVLLHGSKSRHVSTATVTVSNGKTVTPSVTVVPKERTSRYQISVTLEGMNQSIHFYGTTS